MATEKILNTRILLKVDTLENWNSSTIPLKKGELAFATVAASAGTGLTEPVVMVKIGEDGVKTFKDLGWSFYAKASDVISAAKSESALTTFINNVIKDAGIATNEAITALTTRVATAEGDIDALETKVGDTAVATQISTAVTAAKTELKGGTSDTDASATIAGAKKYADKLDTAMDARVDALEASIGEGGSVSAQITAEINKLDKADTAVDGKYVSAVSETDGIITVTRADLPDYSETCAAKKHTHAVADVTGLQTELDKVTTLIGSDASKSVRTIANEELAAQLIPKNAKESLNTLQEIAQWIQDHPDDVTAIHAAIAALQTKVGDTSVAAQIKAVTDPIAAKSHEHANKALLDTYTQTETNLADAVAKKHSHANATELAKFADGDKAKLDTAVQSITAGTGLKATKTGTDLAVDFDDAVTFVFDCGTSAE